MLTTDQNEERKHYNYRGMIINEMTISDSIIGLLLFSHQEFQELPGRSEHHFLACSLLSGLALALAA